MDGLPSECSSLDPRNCTSAHFCCTAEFCEPQHSLCSLTAVHHPILHALMLRICIIWNVSPDQLSLLCRVVMGSDPLQIPPKVWLQMVRSELVPLTAHFAHKLASSKREAKIHSPALRSALKLLSKALLHYLPALAEQPGFADMWSSLLQLFQVC